MKIELFKQYADLRSQLDILNAVEEALKKEILEEMQNNKVEKEEFEYGKFSVGTRKNYIYTEKVLDLEQKVKLAKIREVEKGLADIKETNYVVFKSK